MVNVSSWQLGIDLGTRWEEQTNSLQLTGNLRSTRPVSYLNLIVAEIGSFEPVRLAFAWTQAEKIPLLLGQVNFFMGFDASFYRSQLAFDVSPKGVSA